MLKPLSKRRSVIIDSEADGLLDTATRVWIVCAKDTDTSEKFKWLPGDDGWKDFIRNEVKRLICHNIVGYDKPLFMKVANFEIPDYVQLTDTLLLSEVLNYMRFGGRGHSMENWGELLGVPKQEHEDWSQFSPEMETRCESDVELNHLMYIELKKELNYFTEKNKLITTHLDVEHAVSEWCAMAELYGWPFSETKARALSDILDVEVQKAHEALSSTLGKKAVATDKVKGIVEEKYPKWTKQGFYDAHTARWFGVHPASGFEGEERMIEGPYCRVEFVDLSLDSVSDVKVFLYRNGWEPTEWNYKRDPETNRKAKTSPKITEDSLEFLGGNGKLYTNFAVARSRLGILRGLLSNLKAGRVHGRCMSLGTPSFRATHSLIVNIPSVDSPWGKEMRSLFETPEGCTLIGCDSAGNQARGLAHFLGDADFIHTLLHGDIHQYNADILTEVVSGILGRLHIVERPQAKRILYAFLFGASGGKLWSYVFGNLNEKQGKKLKEGFTKAVPGFATLIERIEKIYGATSRGGKKGYIPALSGARIYVDSFHKLLVYLLQSTEKLTCGAAVMLLMQRLKELGIWYQPCIFMHDEVQFFVKDKDVEVVKIIGKQCFIDGPKLFGIQIMDGAAKSGHNWYETH